MRVVCCENVKNGCILFVGGTEDGWLRWMMGIGTWVGVGRTGFDIHDGRGDAGEACFDFWMRYKNLDLEVADCTWTNSR